MGALREDHPIECREMVRFVPLTAHERVQSALDERISRAKCPPAIAGAWNVLDGIARCGTPLAEEWRKDSGFEQRNPTLSGWPAWNGGWKQGFPQLRA
jgi:hypothetical protein